MLQFKLVPRAARLLLLSAICTGTVLGAAASAMAKGHENASAGAASAEEAAAAQPRRDLCFTTNSAVEAERGIRHWNNCK